MDAGSFHRTKTPLQMVDDTLVVNVFLINSIIECAAFGAIESNAHEPFGNNPNVSVLEYPTQNPVGLWINASHVNHSCIQNVAHSYIGDMMILRAAKNIPKGTEITMAHRKPHADPKIRQAEYQKLFGFRCTCNLCTAEAQRSAFHKLLVTQAAEQPLTWLLSNIEGMARFAEAQALVITTIHAYSTATLKSLPRWSLPEAHACMMFNYRSAKDLDKTEECAIALANDLGYQITIKRTKVHLDRTNAYSDMIQPRNTAHEKDDIIGYYADEVRPHFQLKIAELTILCRIRPHLSNEQKTRIKQCHSVSHTHLVSNHIQSYERQVQSALWRCVSY